MCLAGDCLALACLQFLCGFPVVNRTFKMHKSKINWKANANKIGKG